MKRRVFALLLILATLAGCQPGPGLPSETAESETAVSPIPEENTVWGVPILTREELGAVLALPESSPAESQPTLTYDGAEIPCLADRSQYYLTVDRDVSGWGNGRLEASAGTLSLCEEDLATPLADYMKSGTPLPVYLSDGETFTRLSVIFTTLPVITIDNGGKRIGRSERDCDFTLFLPRDAESGAERIALPATIHARGATSATLSKVGYAVELYKNDRSDTKKVSLLGMRKDDDWILYPAHSDEAKIRDAVCWNLWKAMGAYKAGDAAGTVAFRYVEVILNGAYNGFYVLMEKMDQKTLGLGEGDKLFKVTGGVPTSQELRAAKETDEVCGGVEKKYPDPEDSDPRVWRKMADFVALVYESDSAVFAARIDEIADVENMLDFWLFVQIIMGFDTVWKNNCYAEIDGIIQVYPWDLDITFGLAWDGNQHNYLYEKPDQIDTIFDFRCGSRLIRRYPGAVTYVRNRWEELTSSGVVSEETIIGWGERYWNELHDSGAWDRNLERWPDTTSTEDLSYFRETVINRLDFLDSYFRDLKDAGGAA